MRRVAPTVALKEWIKSAGGEDSRDAVEQALPAPPQPQRVPVRIPIPVGNPRPQRRYY